MEETLRKLLQLSAVRREIEIFHGSEDDTLSDICDGAVFKTHPLFSSDKHAIQIIAYFDEIELCNPLGSSVKKHKLGCLFFTIGNFHPCFRSKLKCIFLVAIASNLVIRKHGINLFLKPFIKSMQEMGSNGLKVAVGARDCVFQVGLLAVLADTLAAHCLGGFKESMSFAYRICRSCMATTEQIQSKFLESNYELRTPEKHQHHLHKLVGGSSATYSVEYGINNPSELDNVPNFSVVQNLPHDIMHDLFEGVVPYEMKLLLTYLVSAKYLSIATFNDRLRRFDFGYSELSDAPSELDEKIVKKPEQRIRQSASKMWLLAVYLPLLIGDLVPEDCKFWSLYILLLKICSIATSWQIKPDTISYLSVLIEEHHTQFKSLYPDRTITPKMHYMVHYPSQIVRYGPLIYSWTMRHEAKLSVIKRASRHGNFKNICRTIARHSQRALCYHLNCGEPFLRKGIDIASTFTECPLFNESEEIRRHIDSLHLVVYIQSDILAGLNVMYYT